MERLNEMFDQARVERRAVLLPFMTAGLPSIEASPLMFAAMRRGGADGFEIGIPYSDPLMDGPVIQEAGQRALAGGVTLSSGIEIARQVAETTRVPTIIMTYVNPILRVGVDTFCERVAAAGASGLIVADLPADEAEALATTADAHGLGLALFVAPTIDDQRLQRVVAMKPPFLYGIAELGVTGERAGHRDRAVKLAERVKAVTNIPLVLGVGISTPDQAAEAAAVADGVIVGSALVRRVLEASGVEQAASALETAVAELAGALRSAR